MSFHCLYLLFTQKTHDKWTFIINSYNKACMNIVTNRNEQKKINERNMHAGKRSSVSVIILLRCDTI